MTPPRYIVRVPSMEEHIRWVDQRLAETRTTRRRRRRK